MSKHNHENKDKSPAVTVAAIDIGSNSIRLVVAQVFENGTFEVLERLQQALKIGQDTFRKGRISAQTMRAAVLILQRFREVLNTYKVEKIRAVATSAVREAANTDNFLDRILIATGLDVKVISAAEESRLNISAVRSVVGKSFLSKRQALVVEVGGGSTILNLIDKGEIKVTQSLAVGSIRLQEVLATSFEPVEQAAKMIDHQVKSAISAISRLLPMKRIRTFIALGGDVRWAAKQVGKPGKFPSITIIQPKNLKSLIQLYQKHSTADLAKSLKISFTDAETLTPALMVYHTLLQSTSAQEIAVCDVSMRDGLLLDFARIVTGKEDESFALQVLNSARAIAAKYHVDLGHSDQVCKLAVSLYDELKRQQWVSIGYRLLLQAAAILHEVGIFISSRAHHKHSYYIIANSEVFGLESKELEMVAHIARYHRRSRPKAAHLEYARLPREQKMVINRLASLLRVADALDVDRTQGVKGFTCRIENDNLIISVTGPTDLSLEKRAMAMKSDLFEEIYGLKIQLEKAE